MSWSWYKCLGHITVTEISDLVATLTLSLTSNLVMILQAIQAICGPEVFLHLILWRLQPSEPNQFVCHQSKFAKIPSIGVINLY